MSYVTNNSLTIFFPVHNEVSNLETLIAATAEVLPDLSPEVEVLIVDDGSTDGSSDLADALAEKHTWLRVIHHEVNRGYGGALQSGFRGAKNNLIFYTDGDGQFDMGELAGCITTLGDADVLSCFRKDRQDAWHRKINTAIYETAVKLIFGLKVHDPDCAYKIYRKSVIDSIQMHSCGALIDVEMLLQAQRAGYRIVQQGVRHLPRQHGQSSGANLQVIARAVRELFRLWSRVGSR